MAVAAEASLSLSRRPTDQALREYGTIDAIVVAGAPWFWDQAASSEKLRWLAEIVDRYPRAIKIVLGAGSCLLPSLKHRMTDEEFVAGCVSDVFSHFDLLIVRDNVALELLNRRGIDAAHMPDPTFFVPVALMPSQNTVGARPLYRERARNRGMVIATPPTTHFLRSYFSKDTLDEWDELVLSKIREGYDLFLWADDDDADYEPYHTLEIKGRLGIASFRQLVDVIPRYSHVVTNRVHAAALAQAFGVPSLLFGYDSRCVTAQSVGSAVIGPGSIYEVGTTFPLEQRAPLFAQITRRIRDAMAPTTLRVPIAATSQHATN
ncbi:polysaccharide pyruvyl transferase family protein [Hyphomicrobium sp. 1Nfss2.1]|uniref:polysaccharide pyruvyl transferase family protein n=1 Tax=Hyphomicrobium sp. 1Nfss2.1 TaxID=3413936 RepID=UPI003C7B05CD